MTIPHNDSMHILLDHVIARWCVQYSSKGTSSCSSAEEKANAVLLKMLINLDQRPYARIHIEWPRVDCSSGPPIIITRSYAWF